MLMMSQKVALDFRAACCQPGRMTGALLSGLLAGAALIIAIGAQNAFVLRQGVRRDHVALVVAVCALSDIVLIAAGTLGMGALVTAHAGVLTLLKYAGALYLLWFAFTSFRSATNPEALDAAAGRSAGRSTLLTALALTWLNPHVYLDTLVLLGSMANTHGDLRWGFALGAMTASVLWFSGVGFGARALAGPLGRPAVWKWLDIGIGLMMVAFAVKLVLG